VYNNSGYVVLGSIIERVTGKSYGRALEERILAPLGMRDTGHEPAGRPVPKLARGYRRTLDGLVPCNFMDMSSVFAAGSLYSTVDDLYRWDQALYSDAVLPAAARERMFDGGKFNYGYGWMLQPPLFAHEGSVYGFHSLILREPAYRILIVLLQNVEGDQWVGDVASGILALFSGTEPRPPRLPASRALRDVWKQSGIDETVRQYREWKVARAHELDFREPELKKLGDWLLRNAKDPRDALEIFRLNAAAYPESAKAQETMGDAYLIVGDAARAIASFERTVELDPDNRTAASTLRRLRAAKR
jgi:tetratricopeptide (TPR) repeat protein